MAKKPVKTNATFDRSKEETIRALVQALTAAGLTVRREELKRGPGWRAVSGVCRLASGKIIFLDRTTRQDEQIEFLVGRFQQFRVIPSETLLAAVPESVRHLLEGRVVTEAA